MDLGGWVITLILLVLLAVFAASLWFLRRRTGAAVYFLSVLYMIPALSLVGALLLSRVHWGYWISPPRPAFTRMAYSMVRKDVFPMGSFEMKGTAGDLLLKERIPRADGSRPTEYPVEHAVYLIQGWVGLGAKPSRSLTSAETKAIRSIPGDAALRGRDARGCDSSARTAGVWARFSPTGSKHYFFVAANGAQSSNDHYPHYRLFYDYRPDGSLRLLSRQLMFFDWAGLEGATWDRILLVLCYIGLTVGLPAAVLFYALGPLTAALRRRRARA